MFVRTLTASLCLLLITMFGCEHALDEGIEAAPLWALDDEAQGAMKLSEVQLAPMQVQVMLHNTSAHPAGATLVVHIPSMEVSERREVVLRADELRAVTIAPALREGALARLAGERVLMELTLLEQGQARAYYSTWWRAPATRGSRGASTP